MLSGHRKTYYIVLGCLWELCFPSILRAQNKDTLKNVSLPDFSVRTEAVQETPHAVSSQTITPDIIEHLPAKDLGDVLKYLSGASVRDYGGIGGIKTVSVRSLGASHTAVYYDFLPVSDCNTGQTNLGRFSQENTESVSLYSGSPDDILHPARMLASASTLVLRTPVPQFQNQEKIHMDAAFRGGSFQLYNPYLHWEQKLGKQWSFSISGKYDYQKGDYPYVYQNFGQTIRGKRSNSEVRNFRLEGNLYHSSPQRLAQAKIFYYDSRQQLPGAIVLYNSLCRQHMEERNLFGQFHFHHLDLFHKQGKWQFQNNEKINYDQLRYTDPDYLNAAHCLENTYRQWEYYLSDALLRNFGKYVSISLANDLNIDHMEADLSGFIPPTRFSSLTALMGKFQHQGHNLADFHAAILHNAYVDMAVGKSTEKTRKWSPSVNLLYRMNGPRGHYSQDWRFSFKDIFRMPTFTECYYRLFGAAALKPEDVKEWNAGCGGQWNNQGGRTLHWEADVFYNKVTNKIVAVPSQNLFVWSMLNFGEVEIRGAEAKLHYTDADILSAWRMQIALDINYTFQHAWDISNPESKTYRQQLPYTPYHSGSGILRMDWRRFSFSYTLLMVGRRYTLGQNTDANRMEAYADHGMSLSYRLPTARIKGQRSYWLFQVHLLNLTNRHYEIIRDYPMPGRQLQGRVCFHF